MCSLFLFRGRPDGTFFVRRKAPSLLVLTYVALSKRANSNANTPSSGGTHRHKGSSARLSSPPPPTSRMRDASGSPLGDIKSGRRATIGPGKDCLADNTTVQVWRDVDHFHRRSVRVLLPSWVMCCSLPTWCSSPESRRRQRAVLLA